MREENKSLTFSNNLVASLKQLITIIDMYNQNNIHFIDGFQYICFVFRAANGYVVEWIQNLTIDQ